MPTIKMKLFSVLMGNSTPSDVGNISSPVPDMTSAAALPADNATTVHPSIEPPGVSVEQTSTHSSPQNPVNLDRLRRIFQALSSLNQNKTTEAEVDEEPLRMRKKYLGIFERFERRFGNKGNSDGSVSKRKPLHSRKERFMALINRRNGEVEERDEAKTKNSWARNNLNRLTSSMRQAKSDSFLNKKKRRSRKGNSENNPNEQLRLPSMKTKNRSSVSDSKKIINSASQTAHTDLVKHLQEANSSQHCLDEIDFWNFEYPFENAVFEGGGAKVHTYIGAIKCLEEAGIKPKRLAGTSAGAITAGLLAVGYTSEEIHILYEYDVEYNVKDGTCGLLSLLPNMFRHYGWNPGERATRWFGECLAVKTGNPDITFQEVLDQYGVELCIVAVNLTNRCEEYFHPKTTPDMPIKLATRMSSSLPGYFQPVKQGSNVYIDGGLLCNYPVHVFDGWWLSMEPEDVFYKKMGSLDNLPSIMEKKNRFGVFNNKTLGFCMFSMFDDKSLRFELEKRHKLKVTERPKTKLFMKRIKQMKERDKRAVNRDAKLDALSRFFKVLRQCHVTNGNDVLNKDQLISEFTQLLQAQEDAGDEREKLTFTQAHVDSIFGEGSDLIAMFDDLHTDSAGTVSNSELIAFLNRHNVDIHAITGQQYLRRPEFSSFGSFFMTIQESLMNSARRVYIQTDDLDRTVGINTDYIKMDDFSLDPEDQEFLIAQGYKATAAFLRYYIHQNYRKPMIESQPVSQENSDLSAEDSDYSPGHAYSCESNVEVSDDEALMMSSTSSKTSRSTKSPTKSIGSLTLQADQVEVHASSDQSLITDDDEVVVAVVEETGNSENIYPQAIESLAVEEPQSSHAPSDTATDVCAVQG